MKPYWKTLGWKMLLGFILGTLTRYGVDNFDITNPMTYVSLGAVTMALLWLGCILIDNHYEYKMITKKQLERYKENIQSYE